MSLPKLVLICCEGKETEPQYLDIVIRHLRIGQKRVIVKRGFGQHEEIINKAILTRKNISKNRKLAEDNIETWVVFDMDTMISGVKEIEDRAKNKNINIAFTAPCFEVFIIQHFGLSSTLLGGKKLEDKLSKYLKDKKLTTKYDKSDLRWVGQMLDEEPGLLADAVHNSNKLRNKAELPYITFQDLVIRLDSLSPQPRFIPRKMKR